MAEQIRGKEMAEQIAILYLAFHGLYLVIYQTLYFKVAQKKKKKRLQSNFHPPVSTMKLVKH